MQIYEQIQQLFDTKAQAHYGESISVADLLLRAMRADTSYAWINSIFLVMNLLVLLRIFFGFKFGRWMKTIMPIQARITAKVTQSQSSKDILSGQKILNFPRYATL